MKHKLVMATNNAGKLREARAIAGDKLEILSLEDIGYHHDIPETADTLEGNALIKVRAIKDACGLDCFADDTGLMVDALGGAPGVHTARYAGEDCNPDKNIDLMLKNMEGVKDRQARFRTCVALSLNGEEHLFEGTAEGSIATERSGSHGFGYDPIFISAETGKCFADMTDEDKNAISHRGRAITAMMKWLSALCLCLFAIFPAMALDDFILYNTFDDKIDNVFDTPDKTYFLAEAQLYSKSDVDNNEKLLFLFCMDKDSGEIRHYNAQNFLSNSLIKVANYNALRNYMLIVYDDLTIDLLHDNGKAYTIHDLKNYSTGNSKEVRSISFDPALNRAYLATDFGYLIIDDKKNEIVSSGIYNEPIDKVIRIADRLLILRDGILLDDNINSNNISISDFKEVPWWTEGDVDDILPLTSDRCVISVKADRPNTHYVVSYESGKENPEVTPIGKLNYSSISENKEGLLFVRYQSAYQLSRNATYPESVLLRDEDSNLICGSWDFRNFTYAKPREGVYTVRREEDGNWTITRQLTRPNAPAVFRSNSLLYTPQHGMLANTHGNDQNFAAHLALNPILLSGLKNGEWTMYGLPYLAPNFTKRLSNPCGIAQDPDNPDVFYFGSVIHGVIRYNIKDMSSLLHITRTDDNPSLPGHVGVIDPYPVWTNAFILLNPIFDKKGNLILAHVNTQHDLYDGEIWIWTPENRRASTSPETFQPFKRLKVTDMHPSRDAIAIPLSVSGTENLIVYVPINARNTPMAVYDHNGTIENASDDRCISMEQPYDNDGNVSYNFLYTAIEDPATGIVWVGTDNGVFTFDPRESFTNPGKVSRIKVSRNDGTSLADYLLSGIRVNSISIDNSGRKWFSLSGGGLICTSADGKTILQELNTDNSKLPSDLVYASCFNPDNNSMMIATSAGLCEYHLSSQSGNIGTSNVRAYPNPVRHDYYGWVTID
ncbi:MAG: RdgB/HAM1 family non-canonical purine NTP pyrophosphatase, partial [Muribaculaceae bacterium]|nr:RdgB/HAM1 family non-canonical purine NTP pyrophosphatase [Muribaculaceae bacterium]